MALNRRSTIDPRWLTHHRPVVRGTMFGKIEIAHVENGASSWNPASGGVFGGTTAFQLHYRGMARIQPNNDWRARKQKWDGETVTEHAVRFQVDLNGNEIVNPNALPSSGPNIGQIHTNDIIKVLYTAHVDGVAMDTANELFTYTIRNVSISSNPWSRTILADFIPNDMQPLTGSGL